MLQKTITGYLQPENKREIQTGNKRYLSLVSGYKTRRYGGMRLFVNAAEAEKLTDGEYQDQIAFSICMALMNCLADQS